MNEETPTLQENKRRLRLYFRQYDAETGDTEMQVVKREPATVNGRTLLLPAEMMNLHPELREGKPIKAMPDEVDDLPEPNSTAINYRINPPTDNQVYITLFERIRMKYDFEYWCLKCVKIQDKLSKQMVPLRLNYGQRLTVHEFERQRLAQLPIRVIIVKARQWGGSTVTQMYMLWLQIFHYRRWHSAIISQLKNQAINIRSMLSSVAASYPSEAGTLTLSGYEGLTNTRYIKERECKILIASAETPDALRSFDFSMLHLSEVGLWKSTPSKSADDLVQALYATVPNVTGSFIVMESTAKGIGNFFHQNYLAAASGQSMMRPVFVPWFAIAHYAQFRHTDGGQRLLYDSEGLPASTLANPEQFISQLTPYQLMQWRQGATLEGIAWYQETQQGMMYSDFMMKSEYPGTAGEAFQAKSNRYFDPEAVDFCRQHCRPPEFTGNICGYAECGPDALKDIELTDLHTPNNELRIWIAPELQQQRTHTLNRFVVMVDIGGVGQKSDWSVISVFDRFNLLHNGCMERAAIWRGHIDHDQLAWKAAQIATFYNHALLAIESNTLETKDRKQMQTYEGNHFYTVIDELADAYDNLFMREVPPDVAGDPPTRHYGWHTNRQTKYLAYDYCRAQLRTHNYLEHDSLCCDEMDWLEIKPNGSLGAIDGQHDDVIDTTAIGLYIGMHEMAPPVLKTSTPIHHHHERTGGIATF